MSDTVKLKAQVREHAGTKSAVQLRRQGQMPAIVYGHKQDPVSISLSAHDFVEHLHHGNRLFDVDINGKAETLLIKDLQYDHLGKEVIHVDLMRVNLAERVKVEVPLELRGTAAGTHQGGMVEELMNMIEIECEVRNIPESIVVNIKDLGLNQTLHAKDIELPAGATLVTDPDAGVVGCHETKAAVAEEEVAVEGEAPTEPEVITERKEEEASS